MLVRVLGQSVAMKFAKNNPEIGYGRTRQEQPKVKCD